MAEQKQNSFAFDRATIAEIIFFAIVLMYLIGPASGLILNVNAAVAGCFSKSTTQIVSTRNTVQKLLESAERIKDLETKLAKQELEVIKLRQQAKDTNKLRQMLDLKTHSDRRVVAAEVVSRNPDNWFEQIIIDRGKLDHISKGAAVITGVGVVGQVTNVSDHASVIRLLTDPDQKLGVLITRLGITGILSGRHQNPAVIDFVPISANVEIGDKIVCLGKAGTFPENHPVGTIIGVRHDNNATSTQIEVKLAENCYDLSEVLVLPPLEE
jgi:rod shape-determining protein MreC